MLSVHTLLLLVLAVIGGICNTLLGFTHLGCVCTLDWLAIPESSMLYQKMYNLFVTKKLFTVTHIWILYMHIQYSTQKILYNKKLTSISPK
uniref:Uncharacterized protein n=1 Tax=Anguilla anguilla TaxID=7936 RepID=A0A0E9R4T4_ANGAN